MTYDGHVENGRVVLDESVTLPEGARVSVCVELGTEGGGALNWLAEHAADSEACPPDLAQQHDHYLYGAPKKGA